MKGKVTDEQRKSYFKILFASAIIIGMIFLSAMLFFGYQLTSADPIGFLITVPMIAYIVFLLKRSWFFKLIELKGWYSYKEPKSTL